MLTAWGEKYREGPEGNLVSHGTDQDIEPSYLSQIAQDTLIALDTASADYSLFNRYCFPVPLQKDSSVAVVSV